LSDKSNTSPRWLELMSLESPKSTLRKLALRAESFASQTASIVVYMRVKIAG